MVVKSRKPETNGRASRSASARTVEADEQVRATIATGRISPSPTNPRKTFDEAKLEELAASFRRLGILQPLVVRPIPLDAPLNERTRFELVAGERRLRAAAIAEAPQVPVVIRRLTDEQVLEAQLVENDQREDVLPSERVAAYRRLADAGRTAEQIADGVGLPLSSVRDLLRLGRCPSWFLEAVDRGEVPVSVAAIVARVPGESDRTKACACAFLGAESITGIDEDDLVMLEKGKKFDRGLYDAPLTHRQARELVTCFQRELKSAPFSRKALDLWPGAGSCDECPKRAGNAAKEDPEYKGVRADTCLDPSCYAEKVKLHDGNELAKGTKKGYLPPPDSFKWPLYLETPPAGWCDIEVAARFTEIGSELYGSKKVVEQTLSEILGKLDRVYFGVLDNKHKLRALIKTADARKFLVERGVLKKPDPRPKRVPLTEEENRRGVEAIEERIEKLKNDSRPAMIDDVEACDLAAEIGAGKLAAMVSAKHRAAEDDCGSILVMSAPSRLIARFLIRDHYEFGPERRVHVARALGIDPDKPANLERYQEAADKLSHADVFGLCVRLAAAPVLTAEGGASKGFAFDLLAWGGLKWDDLLEEARQQLSPGPTADASSAGESDASHEVLGDGKKDRTAAIEDRIAASFDRDGKLCPADANTSEQIAEWRQRQAAGESPEWNKWAEFQVQLADGSRVEVLYRPRWLGQGTDHFEFWGESTSSSGYRSHFETFGSKKPKVPLIEWVKTKAEELAATTKAEAEKEERRAKRNGSKPEPVGAHQPPARTDAEQKLVDASKAATRDGTRDVFLRHIADFPTDVAGKLEHLGCQSLGDLRDRAMLLSLPHFPADAHAVIRKLLPDLDQSALFIAGDAVLDHYKPDAPAPDEPLTGEPLSGFAGVESDDLDKAYIGETYEGPAAKKPSLVKPVWLNQKPYVVTGKVKSSQGMAWYCLPLFEGPEFAKRHANVNKRCDARRAGAKSIDRVDGYLGVRVLVKRDIAGAREYVLGATSEQRRLIAPKVVKR